MSKKLTTQITSTALVIVATAAANVSLGASAMALPPLDGNPRTTAYHLKFLEELGKPMTCAVTMKAPRRVNGRMAQLNPHSDLRLAPRNAGS